MTFAIRPARSEDAAAIAGIIQTALNDNPGEAHVRAVLDTPSHTTMVAAQVDGVVGFAAGFITTNPQGQPRWELDLLGVDPDQWGRGLGRQLVRACTEAGYRPGLTHAQGLVKATNIGSQKAFAYAGYQCLPEVCGLFVSEAILLKEVAQPDGAHLIPVTTLTYHGIWLEGQITTPAVHAALAWRTRENRHTVGAVVPLTNTPALRALHAADFAFIGEFQWWRRPFSS